MEQRLIDALRYCAKLQDCFACKYQYTDTCKSSMAKDAADAIERLVAEVEQWKQAWQTAYKLYDSAKNEKLAGQLVMCAGNICTSEAPECEYRKYGAFECQGRLMLDAADALCGKEIEDD